MTRITAEWLTQDSTQTLFRTFEHAHHQLLAVGGCVRNTLLGMPVSDIDMATDAWPDQVMDIAQGAGFKVIPTGIDHGTITVVVQDVPYEITSFRMDVETDGRHAKIAYAGNRRDDAKRRDFTMNALYADAAGHVLDGVGGLDDLHARKVRFIGDAGSRIKEDYLRILRFFRFFAHYGDPSSGIDAEGLAACAEHAEGLGALSRERIGAEMRKILSAPDPAPAVASMSQSGVLMRVMPGAEPMSLPVLVHLEAGADPDWIRRALVLGGEAITETWRLSRSEARVLDLGKADLQAETSLAEMAYRHGARHARNVAFVRAAHLQQPVAPDFATQIVEAAQARFPVDATDLMPSLNGPALGEKLRALESEWIASAFRLTRDELLRR